ncbi:disulfide bond formation protein B [Croceicoccus mobilis]|uniref:Dihydroneopterin aldolase n=1 Tax=Croceicoccus mobilis TaxID=1703339 RepID=A0A916YSU1_9SPHN|nr:disulfide bond formation protein B [Croceicoccus mobilis]GGD59770.1 dihydroneopterin aldolase [Croceicoccus mobilis]
MTTPNTRNLALARALALLVPAALLAGAYFSQYVGGLYPCEMCWWQRYAHFAALVPAVLAFLAPGALRLWLVRLAGAAILVAALIGGFHAGVEYGWWEGITTCATTVQAGGDPLEAVLNAPVIRCDVTPWSLFGISLAGYNFLISGVAAIAVLVLSARKSR